MVKEKKIQVKKELEKFKDSLSKTFDNVFSDKFELDLSSIKKNFNQELKGLRSPVLDFYEKGKTQYTLDIELPGITQEDIQLEVKNGTLTLQAQRDEKIKQEDEEKGLYKIERSHIGFFRTISLPKDVNEKKVKAEFNNGLLKVTLGRLKESQTSKNYVKIN